MAVTWRPVRCPHGQGAPTSSDSGQEALFKGRSALGADVGAGEQRRGRVLA
jgi:hypothetical protein